ncbi:uncharacterized protein (TIGR00375 family) [Anoxybacillus vitaminiphilus]|uniref:Uncharacterized protein (TIGR00375 family) n=1 Tax=Paranoxybacillus vitaminiphilus TaxID=581036 RepID=A0A327YW87_9BACL|nr:endonuclease Q family protein [Anoxybacillus vitaminiphilus]RAK22259.1 uncharacterized protein (TIGR00375 family) [Anoxybacillus vitaminiphilus]
MNNYYVDLHIHIGRTASGKPVKITGAKTLTLPNILTEASETKGLNMIGIIDCHVPEVLAEIEHGILTGAFTEHQDGGVRANDMTVILGSEIEVYDEHCQGPIHVLAFFPTVETMRLFSQWLEKRVKNISLSSQRMYGLGKELQKIVKQLGGLFVPAHAFTPFKSLYGKGVRKSLTEVFDADLIDAIELGLSADTKMADQIAELHRYSYLSNSDAHSLRKIAREYQIIRMEAATFAELKKALKREEGRAMVANYGLNPLLGKYHQTVCENCLHPLENGNEPCSVCGHRKQIKGVFERLQELKTSTVLPGHRPPYIYQVPLEFIPGLGPKAYQKLLSYFGTEMRVLHDVSCEQLTEVVGEKLANLIVLARSGKLHIHAGGGGKYGKIAPE